MNELPKVGDIIVRMGEKSLWIVESIDDPVGAPSPSFRLLRADGTSRLKVSGWTLASSFWERLQTSETK